MLSQDNISEKRHKMEVENSYLAVYAQLYHNIRLKSMVSL